MIGSPSWWIIVGEGNLYIGGVFYPFYFDGFQEWAVATK